MKSQTMSDNVSCATGLLERPRYFPRQLITPAEMTQEQDYFRQKMRLHNRMLHGWGVVCGALVCEVPEPDDNGNGSSKPWHVKVKPGYVLGPYGDEIVIDCEHEIDLRSHGLDGVTGEPPEQAPDPWCCDVTIKRDPEQPLYIAVKYKECMTRPVRVQPVGCGCDDTQCEYSRWRDGYEIGILDECPPSHQQTPPELVFEAESPGCPKCPECPDDPWVVLAKVTVAEDGAIESIEICECHRLVFAFGNHWWLCEHCDHDGPQAPSDPDIVPRPIEPGLEIDGETRRRPWPLAQGSDHTITIVGLERPVTADPELRFVSAVTGGSDGIEAAVIEFERDKILAKFSIKPDAALGLWNGQVEVDGRPLRKLKKIIKVEKRGNRAPGIKKTKKKGKLAKKKKKKNNT